MADPIGDIQRRVNELKVMANAFVSKLEEIDERLQATRTLLRR